MLAQLMFSYKNIKSVIVNLIPLKEIKKQNVIISLNNKKNQPSASRTRARMVVEWNGMMPDERTDNIKNNLQFLLF